MVIQELFHQFSLRQQQPRAIPAVDETQHECLHCGYSFKGRICPQCGMPAVWKRFTWKRLFFNFLDLWGMGNRPMFRTLGDLVWRPGYMIRDYLSGHHLAYFPPFKMLAILTLFMVVLLWAFDIDMKGNEKVFGAIKDVLTNEEEPTPWMVAFLGMARRVWDYFDNNMLYRIVLQNIFVVLAVWGVFRKRGYNLVETFFSQIYINCQMQMITIATLLLTQHCYLFSGFPYAVYPYLVYFVLAYDFCQLYDMSYWSAFWRSLMVMLLLISIYLFFLLVIIFSVLFLDEVIS